ncbi:hypothetical protein QJS66_11370 [Kocuria rhizophila]|nr:hypothetical protein QJS66_11370 [Kocuria rhizophila]
MARLPWHPPDQPTARGARLPRGGRLASRLARAPPPRRCSPGGTEVIQCWCSLAGGPPSSCTCRLARTSPQRWRWGGRGRRTVLTVLGTRPGRGAPRRGRPPSGRTASLSVPARCRRWEGLLGAVARGHLEGPRRSPPRARTSEQRPRAGPARRRDGASGGSRRRTARIASRRRRWWCCSVERPARSPRWDAADGVCHDFGVGRNGRPVEGTP